MFISNMTIIRAQIFSVGRKITTSSHSVQLLVYSTHSDKLYSGEQLFGPHNSVFLTLFKHQPTVFVDVLSPSLHLKSRPGSWKWPPLPCVWTPAGSKYPDVQFYVWRLNRQTCECVCVCVCPCRLYGDSLQFTLYHHQCVLVKKGAKQADGV